MINNNDDIHLLYLFFFYEKVDSVHVCIIMRDECCIYIYVYILFKK